MATWSRVRKAINKNEGDECPKVNAKREVSKKSLRRGIGPKKDERGLGWGADE